MNEKRRYPVSVSFLFIFIMTVALSAYVLSVIHKLVAVMVSGH